MADYRLSNDAKNDLIRIHQYGVKKFGVTQADKYFGQFFDCFETIAQNPYSFESAGFIRKDYRRCPCGSDSIFYRIIDDMVEIMAVVGRQDLNKFL